MAKKTAPDRTVCRNRKATHRFHILEKIECGIALVGTEVKSLRERDASIEEAYARIENDELWLVGCHIAAYKFGHTRNHEPQRRRKLLLHAREIHKLKPKTEQKGLTLVPLAIYFNERGIAKVSLGLAVGKKVADKRQDLKARDHKREIDRAMRRKR
jgi:SsrA-binding protein